MISECGTTEIKDTYATVTEILSAWKNWSGGTKIFMEIWSSCGKLVPMRISYCQYYSSFYMYFPFLVHGTNIPWENGPRSKIIWNIGPMVGPRTSD